MSLGRSRLVGMCRVTGNAITSGGIWEIGKYFAVRADLLELNSDCTSPVVRTEYTLH
jgi:hypothetical protein